MPETGTVNKNGIHNKGTIDRMTLVSYTGQNNEGTERDRDTQTANFRKIEKVTDENDARILGEFPR